ncbi:alpha/beta-hydrolase [Lophiostoma macrostomum CBS 122681]|uniref:Alpha/beta-hydrolase n=1 Tax=Lophiostoma macrostomum CBS 122681 TaxID=1314788 RepID=A0A6A6SZJ5_9PLEO|nr:alpha/beta-hydrolase [Lophiostoma macrostomum CBS 122681]
MGRFTTFVTAGLAATAAARPWERRQDDGDDSTDSMVYDFADIEPSADIVWVPCFDDPKLSCANLYVPMDYYDDNNTDWTTIAWIKYSSGNDSAQDILFNPGGPGGSGIDYVATSGWFLAETLGEQYNIISFDPRGVNNSGPGLTCFPGDLADWSDWYTAASLTAPLPEQYASNKAYGEFCSAANAATNASFSGTVATTQDIMYFIDENHLAKGLDGSAELWFYGVSYGTVMGQTLAALYPDRIGRMILDGNVYGVQHYTGVITSDVDDTDIAFHSFFQYCYAAGPARCAFYGNSTTQQQMEDRYISLLQKLRDEPVGYADLDVASYPGVVRDVDISSTAFSMMYDALTNFPTLAVILSELENGVADAYVAYQTASSDSSIASRSISARNPVAHDPNYDSSEALQLITCLDANTNYPVDSYDDFLDARALYMQESFYGGNGTSLTNMPMCVGMSLSPPPSQRFPGFELSGISTAFPILFTNTLADPITPISSAEAMSALFGGSVVLAQNSTGHSVTSSKSQCSVQYMQEYLSEGWLPPRDTVCQPDVLPFMDEEEEGGGERRRLAVRRLRSW